ncbi:MAG: Hsp20/alpha crystallin family protein [Deltaproteobacteria bacterium]|nr:Hsp20/alpha crystallin family protein [Deltaproteobacteria bacterium]
MARLRVWDPWRDFGSLQGRINKMFDDTMRSVTPGDEELATGAWSPAVDIHETDDTYVVSADLPGLNKEDIHIDVEDNTITIKGEKKFEEKVPRDKYIRVERTYGTFVRSFSLPQNVDSKKIKATFKDGILDLTLPKKEEAKPKKIAIDVN